MNLKQSRIGILTTPTTPLWTGTVVSSTGADTFTLTVTPKTGLTTAMIGLAVDAGGELIRIKGVNTSGANAVLSLAENGVSSATGGGFEAGATVNIYNVRYPMPKFQRIQTNVVTVAVDGGGANPFLVWRFSNTGGYTSLYWDIQGDGKVRLYNDSAMENESKVAAGQTVGTGVVFLTAKNGSGIAGLVHVLDDAPGLGTLAISPFELTKDYDITYTSLGADDTSRSKAVQAPIPIVNPEAAYVLINTNIIFAAAGSFATYDGWAAGARAPATIGATGYVWDAGADGTIVSGQNSNSLTVKWSSAGFRYLKLTVTDSNGTTAVRYIPVWVSISPFTSISKCDLSWRLGDGWSANLEFKAPPTMLRHSLVAVLDLDTTEILFCGYVWTETFTYDFEKTTLGFTAYTALAFLKNCNYYPFDITGVKGDPEDSYSHGWADFDMNSVPRGVYFLLRWHTNFLELANAQFDVRPSVAPSALAAENRLEYIRDFTAGTLLDQLNVVAKSAMYALYGLRLGGFEVIPDLLYGSAITGVIAETGVNSDGLTLDLTAPNIVAPVSYEMGTPTISDARLSGFYYDASLNFFPIVVRAPSHPGAYGHPAEVPNLIANGPGYAEMIRWAGRHIGLANLARKYTLRSLVDVDPKTYKMIDLPDPANPLAQIRIVVEDETLQLDAASLAWQFKMTGRTFGTTADACVEPPNPTPVTPPVIPPIPTVPEESAFVAWLQGASPDVYYASKTLSGAWSTPAKVNDGAHVCESVSLAADAAGSLYAVWADDRNGAGRYDVFLSVLAYGDSTWSTPIQVNSTGAIYDHSGVSADIDDLGLLRIAWLDNRNGNVEIYYRSYNTGTGTLGTEERATTGAAAGGYIDLAVRKYNGDVCIVYGELVGGYRKVFSAERISNSWTTRRVDDSFALNATLYNAVAIDSSGMAHVVYIDNSDFGYGAGYKPRYAQRASGSEWSASESVIGTEVANGYYWNSIVVSGAGVVSVVCSKITTLYLFQRSGGAWGAGEAVGVTGAFSALRLDGSSGLHLVYVSSQNVYHAARSGAWGAPAVLTTAGSTISAKLGLAIGGSEA